MNQDKITNFICSNYCQFCGNADNSECNVYEIQEKYQANELTAEQMAEVDKFELDKVACKNHVSNEGFTMFGHKILIHYLSGLREEPDGWFSTQRISQLWYNDKDVDYIEIIFSDV